MCLPGLLAAGKCWSLNKFVEWNRVVKILRIVIIVIFIITLISSVIFGYFQYAKNKELNDKLDKTRTSLIEAKVTLEGANVALTKVSGTTKWLTDGSSVNKSEIISIRHQVDSAYKLIVEIKNNLD